MDIRTFFFFSLLLVIYCFGQLPSHLLCLYLKLTFTEILLNSTQQFRRVHFPVFQQRTTEEDSVAVPTVSLFLTKEQPLCTYPISPKSTYNMYLTCFYERQRFWQTNVIWSAFSQPLQKVFGTRTGTEKLLPTALHLAVVFKRTSLCWATDFISCLISLTAELPFLSMHSGRQKYQAKHSLCILCIGEIVGICWIHWRYDQTLCDPRVKLENTSCFVQKEIF